MKKLCKHDPYTYHVLVEDLYLYDGWYMVWCTKCKKAQLRDVFKDRIQFQAAFNDYCQKNGLTK